MTEISNFPQESFKDTENGSNVSTPSTPNAQRALQYKCPYGPKF